MSGKNRILIVSTSADRLGSGPTGVWMDEITAPYYVFQKAGFDVTVASVRGGKIPVDEKSLSEEWAGPSTQTFLQDEAARKAFEGSIPVADILSGKHSCVEDYVALYIPGGHGIVADGDDKQLTKVVETFYGEGRVIGAVCHGPAALLEAQRMALTSSGSLPILHGAEVTGFSDSEERAIVPPREMPYSLEGQLREQGATYKKADDWASFVVTSGRIVTGQNPQSSQAVGEAVVSAVKHNELIVDGLPVAA